MTESDIVICGHGSGTPRTTNMKGYLTQRYSKTVTKGGVTWHKGLVAVLRPKGMTDALRSDFQRKYKTILGRNSYSQTLRKYCYTPYKDGKYYSDCSSSQCLTLSAIGLNIPDYNTVEMYQSSRFEKILVGIEKGHVKEPELLRVGDQLLFAGSDPSRPLHIGHVEGIYAINGKSADSIVAKYQAFLNKNYKQLLVMYCGGVLDVDGDYGTLTRAASVAIWKYMVNKYYDGHLTPGNPYFYESSEEAAESITSGEVAKHPTFGYILNGVLAGRGYRSIFSGSIAPETTAGILALQGDKSIPQTGRLSGETWKALFN